MKKKTKIILSSIIMVVVLIIGGFAGGKYYLNQKEEQQHEEMVSYVKKYNYLAKQALYDSDKNDFIQSVTINYKTVKHNPMGGIDFEGTVNNDKSLIFSAGIDKITTEGKTKIELTDFSMSSKLAKAIGDD